jgi:signal peptidase I
MAAQSETISPPPKSVAENVRETLESIVVAFILAFVFRAFIVEAFVIPTGSMAVTLYGDHLTNTCSTCGYEYAVGITEQMSRYRTTPYPLCCPNCNSLTDQLDPRNISRPDSGDRILVHKWPFDIGGQYLGPHRWDVTVFKDPKDGTTNFIKRLVGLPGEVLEIIDGDVYTVKMDKLRPEVIQAFEQLRRDVYAHREASSAGSRIDFIKRYGELNRQVLPLMEIQRKDPHEPAKGARAQKSLWCNVYNNDFLPNYARLPAQQAGTRVGWEPVDTASAAAWKADQREIAFRSELDQPLAIRFAGKEIDDFFAYNDDGVPERGPSMRQRVGDVRLRFTWFPEAGSGGLTLSMNRDKDEFTADIRTDGSVSVEGLLPDADIPGHRLRVGEKKLPAFAPGAAVDVEFVNLDYRVYLFINGEQVIVSDDRYAPQLAKLTRMIEAALQGEDQTGDVKPTQVQIAAHRLQCRLRHVVIERDVYYRSQRQPESPSPYYNWPGWGTSGSPILLRPRHVVDGKTYGAEYFMCGDNSPASKDSRLWWEIGPHLQHLGEEYQVGTVPEDQLIGKAFFVYWPSGYRPSWAPGIGMIPNVGRMRWIR